MTREEAIKILKFERGYFCDFKGCQEQQAFTMAIKALESQPCEDWKFYYNHGYAQARNDVLDKIRAEIIELRSKQNVGVLECLDIIDKYKAESDKEVQN